MYKTQGTTVEKNPLYRGQGRTPWPDQVLENSPALVLCVCFLPSNTWVVVTFRGEAYRILKHLNHLLNKNNHRRMGNILFSIKNNLLFLDNCPYYSITKYKNCRIQYTCVYLPKRELNYSSLDFQPPFHLTSILHCCCSWKHKFGIGPEPEDGDKVPVGLCFYPRVVLR